MEMTRKIGKEPSKEMAQEVSHDFGTNVGQALKNAKLQSKDGKKLSKLKEQLEEANVILKTMQLDDSVYTSKEKMKKMLNIFYSGTNLDRHLQYLSDKETTKDVVTQAFNVYISRDYHYEEDKEKLMHELED